jgi:hypothetical protein
MQVTFSIPNRIIEGKLGWLSGLILTFLGKTGLNTENTDGLAALPLVIIGCNPIFIITRDTDTRPRSNDPSPT